MKQLVKNAINSLKSVRGNSLAEFATTTALMATLAATAAPKLSELSEGTKSEKSRNEIDKILKIAGNHYQDTADSEGRGRFPNQQKFNVAIGGPNGGENYSNGGDIGGTYVLSDDMAASLDHESAIFEDLGFGAGDGWNRFDESHANVWQSVFGLVTDEDLRLVGGVQDAVNYNELTSDQGNEWDRLFSDEMLKSAFQDGHYVYTVIAGGGTGSDVYPPSIYVADVESVRDFNNALMP